MTEHIEGLVAAPYTPMKKGGAVDTAVIERYASFLTRNGVAGAFVCGSSGESLSLTVDERKRIAEAWIAAAPASLKVIVHVGHNCLDECSALAAHAAEAGAFAAAAMPPVFFKPASMKSLVDFCAAVALAAPNLPFYYYHIPSLTGVDVPMAGFLAAAADRIPTLAGVKYTYEDLMDFEECLQFEDGRFDMLFGRDESLLCSLALGARGGVGSTYNFAAPLYTRMMAAFEAGDLETARGLQSRSMEMIRLLLRTGETPVGTFKAMMKVVGVDCGPARPPLRNLTPRQYKELAAGLERIGFSEYGSR
jgi:N-acetylneuraminate lyase